MIKRRFIIILLAVVILSGCENSSNDNKVPEVSSQQTNTIAESNDPELNVIGWGPQETVVGTTFNKQSNGLSAIWFRMEGKYKLNTQLELWMGDTKLKEFIFGPDLLGSSFVPNELLNKVGEVPLYLIHGSSKKRFDIGLFRVKERPIVNQNNEEVVLQKKQKEK